MHEFPNLIYILFSCPFLWIPIAHITLLLCASFQIQILSINIHFSYFFYESSILLFILCYFGCLSLHTFLHSLLFESFFKSIPLLFIYFYFFHLYYPITSVWIFHSLVILPSFLSTYPIQFTLGHSLSPSKISIFP